MLFCHFGRLSLAFSTWVSHVISTEQSEWRNLWKAKPSYFSTSVVGSIQNKNRV